MKTLLIYDSKRGGTKEIAQLIAEQLTPPAIPLSLDDHPAQYVSEAEQIVFCAPAYAGQLRKSSRQFLESCSTDLLGKPLFLVNTGIQFEQEKVKTQLETLFPNELFQHAKLTIFVGTIAHIEKMNFFERIILKKIFNEEHIPYDPNKPYQKIDQEKISLLVETLNS